MGRRRRLLPEVEEGAIRLVKEGREEQLSRWAAMSSVVGRRGCGGETQRKWIRQVEMDSGERAGQATAERERLKQLE